MIFYRRISTMKPVLDGAYLTHLSPPIIVFSIYCINVNKEQILCNSFLFIPFFFFIVVRNPNNSFYIHSHSHRRLESKPFALITRQTLANIKVITTVKLAPAKGTCICVICWLCARNFSNHYSNVDNNLQHWWLS